MHSEPGVLLVDDAEAEAEAEDAEAEVRGFSGEIVAEDNPDDAADQGCPDCDDES